MRSLIGVLTVLAVTGIAADSSAQKKKPEGLLHELMQKKLKNSQLVLEGLAIADFGKITRGAETLIQISKTAEWRVIGSPRYDMHSNEFRRAAENLIQKAKDKNIDGAAFAYVELTLTCVRCHQYVRDTRDARRDVRTPSVAAIVPAITTQKESP